MKIYDCFIFYNEIDLLEIRLNELNEFVDYFVLVESKLTHRKNNKELLFNNNKQRFKPFLDKIIHIILDENEFVSGNPMDNEIVQRNAISKGLVNANNDDFIIISDIDEIPRGEALKNYLENNPHVPAVFSQYFFYYYLNTFLVSRNGNINNGSTIFQKHQIVNNIQACRDGHLRDNVYSKIDNGGWHFSFLGDKANVINKIKNYSHSTDFGHLTEEQISIFYDKMTDPLGRGEYTITKTDDFSILPKYIQQNLEKFNKLIKH
jgi:hypothetical protein